MICVGAAGSDAACHAVSRLAVVQRCHRGYPGKSLPAAQSNHCQLPRQRHCRAVLQHVLSAAKSDPLRMDRPELEV